MNGTFSKTIALLMSIVLLFSLLSACSDEDTSSASSSTESLTSDATSSEPTVSDTSSEVTSSDTVEIPKPDVTFKPDNITFSKDFLDKYSYYPTISENLSQIHINTADGSNSFATDYNRSDKLLDKIEYVDAEISVCECDEKYQLNNVEAEVKVRGNYTLNYDKKPIRIKFSKKQSMLGLHNGEKYKNWVLLADWKDLSMLNNVVSLYLGKAILGADGYYCTDFKNVELYLNGEYWGMYLLVEQQESKDGRMSVPEVEDDYEGTDIGYVFEYDGYYVNELEMPEGAGDPTFTIDHFDKPYDQPGYTIKSDINHSSQLQFISNYVQNAYTILYAATENGRYMGFNKDYTGLEDSAFSTSEEAIRAVIDVDSLVDTYIINEIACDLDVDWSSFYMTLDMSEKGSKKLIFEAPWDFDSSYGIIKRVVSDNKLYAMESLNPWFNLLKNEDWFIGLIMEKWQIIKQAGVLDNALSLVLEYKTVYEDAYKRNYEKWKRRVTGGNGEVVPEINTYTTQAQAADYLYRWLKARLLFLDDIWGKL